MKLNSNMSTGRARFSGLGVVIAPLNQNALGARSPLTLMAHGGY